MGNKQSSIVLNLNENNLNNGQKDDILMETLIKCKSKSKSNDEFIAKYNKLNCIMNDNINIDISDHRRIVWVSLIGLYQTWRHCPSYILYSSLIIIPLKRDWIYHPRKYKKELEKSILSQSSIFQTDDESLYDFIQLLQWKDGQGFVFWALNDYHIDSKKKNGLLIAPFWHSISTKLATLYDPVTRCKYNGINDDAIRKNILHNGSKYDVSIDAVLSELHSVNMKYKTIKEIIYQSNSGTLNPITSYIANNNNNNNTKIVKAICIYDDDDGNEDEANLWVSSDYDPYDHHVEIDNNI